MGFSSLLLPEAVPRPGGIVVHCLFAYSESTHLDIIVVLEGFFADPLSFAVLSNSVIHYCIYCTCIYITPLVSISCLYQWRI